MLGIRRMNMPINYLELVDRMPFPATKAEIVLFAQNHGASEEALDGFQALPEGTYENFAMLSNRIGQIDSLPGSDSNMFSSSQSR
jgi:hypothetical protein